MLRLLRLFRLLRIGKASVPFNSFILSYQRSRGGFSMLVFYVAVGLALFGTLVWLAEQTGEFYSESDKQWYYESHESSPFQSIPHSFWWAVVTFTTVGYGDNIPQTPLGKVRWPVLF